MPAANGRHQCCLCAMIGALALAAAPLANAQPAFARSSASTAEVGTEDIAIYALGMIGVDYRLGGSTPENGLDCSGLVQHVFQQVTGVSLPRTAKEMSGLGSKVNISELVPGDLVFFNTRRFSFSHVGIYLGGHRFVHAPSRGGEVEIAALTESYWHRRFDGGRRLVGVLPSLRPGMRSPAFANSAAAFVPGFASANYAESTP
jgi:cell wall-associated NlpC family hydrolase